MPTHSGHNPAARATPVSILRATAAGLSAHGDSLATEEPLEIRLGYEKRGGIRVSRVVSVTMRTPGSDAELAAGFLFGEGLIHERSQVLGIAPAGGNAIRVDLAAGVEVDLRSLERHFYTTSSCGVCGKSSIEALGITRQVVLPADGPVMDLRTVMGLPDKLRENQAVFERTGGLHGAALFEADGRLISVREDVGRHNAVDKVIGGQFLAGATPLSRAALVVSGRASFELMQKALVAGIPILVAVGAPSSLAVEVALRYGATLLGFVRDGRVNVYSGAHRLSEAVPAAPTSRA
jgi:FdhD protein